MDSTPTKLLSKHHLMTVIGFSMLMILPIDAKANPHINAFGTCFSEDGIYINNNSFSFREAGYRGVPDKWIKGGTYVTTRASINKSDYGGKTGVVKTTAYRLKLNDGTWVGKLYLPLKMANVVCY